METTSPVLTSVQVALQKWNALNSTLSRLPMSLILLAMRISIGMVFFNSGLLKARSFQFAVKLFEDEYRLPLIDPTLAAQLAMAVELSVPLLLIAGLATRLATLPLLAMVGVIQVLVYSQAWVEHLLWTSVLLTLLTRGAGVLSLDHLASSWLHRISSPAARRPAIVPR